jgi:hypothetical protein
LAKVFLSYAREDESAANQLADSIARAGHDVWLAAAKQRLGIA